MMLILRVELSERVSNPVRFSQRTLLKRRAKQTAYGLLALALFWFFVSAFSAMPTRDAVLIGAWAFGMLGLVLIVAPFYGGRLRHVARPASREEVRDAERRTRG